MNSRQYELLSIEVLLVGLSAVVVATVDVSAAVSALLSRPVSSAGAAAGFLSQPFTTNFGLAVGGTVVLGIFSLLLCVSEYKRPAQPLPSPSRSIRDVLTSSSQEETVDE
jgi:hypothetical protein